MQLIILLFISAVFGSDLVLGAWPEYPENEYEYSLKRDELLEAERLFQGKDLDLTQVIIIFFEFVWTFKKRSLQKDTCLS